MSCWSTCAPRASRATPPKRLWAGRISPATRTACRLIRKNRPSPAASAWAAPPAPPAASARPNSARSPIGSSRSLTASPPMAKTQTPPSRPRSKPRSQTSAQNSLSIRNCKTKDPTR
ncbi:hypothetical protein RA28_10425 [Ruegeria sp. ANG-S4]|nr:hypothetical protein RA28_10425 [Ruegeria sp. ANG-S4]